MDTNFLYRGVTRRKHEAQKGQQLPKECGPFAYEFHWGEAGAVWDGITWGSSEHNAVVRHQVDQAGFPTSGLSTTPHLDRAKLYARGKEGTSEGVVYKIDRRTLGPHRVREFVVAKYCAPSVVEDDEVILVAADGGVLPAAIVVGVIMVDGVGADV